MNRERGTENIRGSAVLNYPRRWLNRGLCKPKGTCGDHLASMLVVAATPAILEITVLNV